MNERTFGALAGQNVHAFLAAFKRGFAIVQTEFTFRILRAVATQATGFQNRFDIARENNVRHGRRRQFGNIHFVGKNARTKNKNEQPQTHLPKLRSVVRRAFQ